MALHVVRAVCDQIIELASNAWLGIIRYQFACIETMALIVIIDHQTTNLLAGLRN